ncbi:hypothetical protein [Absidia glauca]|uniref:Uncharacterized protein n=1 Tax=Absidia glauca TaxID=4829 RepID=A0A163JLB3_ABSGL|nr:hypothetical protein [Absidia glauca]
MVTPYSLYRAAAEDPDGGGDRWERRDGEGKEELDDLGGGDTETREEVGKNGEPDGQFGGTQDEKVLE